MNTQLHNAYQTHQRSDETFRETEAHALLSCASKLELARQEGSSREAFSEALQHNQRLWTVFQVCLCDPENELPKDIKVLLLNLSNYVDKVTFRALAEGNRTLLRSLININRTLAAGLSKNPAQDQTKSKAESFAPSASTPEQSPSGGLITSA
ncbi:MAG: flagellar biosynthesis regulatory protein FlaF [Proteobacteria bacterium]|jgi:flagellar protein FlaF|nr:flagellar biosynthesis regulator FlaF [Alphaproteobacteria bacterium]NCC04092.1 flagellar biosynthesis regulatory protein FlaF [Pseudomonadota bacterium]